MMLHHGKKVETSIGIGAIMCWMWWNEFHLMDCMHTYKLFINVRCDAMTMVCTKNLAHTQIRPHPHITHSHSPNYYPNGKRRFSTHRICSIYIKTVPSLPHTHTTEHTECERHMPLWNFSLYPHFNATFKYPYACILGHSMEIRFNTLAGQNISTTNTFHFIYSDFFFLFILQVFYLVGPTNDFFGHFLFIDFYRYVALFLLKPFALCIDIDTKTKKNILSIITTCVVPYAMISGRKPNKIEQKWRV